MNIITQLILICMAIVFVPAVIIVILDNLFGWDLVGDGYDDSSAKTSDKHSYTHKDLYGLPTGFSTVSNEKGEHYSKSGYSASHRSGNDIYHYGTDGYHGRSHRSDNGEVTHYGKDNLPRGYSRPNVRGGYDHFDRWNLPTGNSTKD